MDFQEQMKRFGVLVAWALCEVSSVTAQASNLAPLQQQGVAWLASLVQGDGSLANENASIATQLQARQESALTLHVLTTTPGALATKISGDTETNTEYTARRVLAAAATAQPASADITSLLSGQNSDGGWGLAPGYQSDALDTAIALQALGTAGASSLAAARALTYLSQAMHADGGWGVGNQSSVYTAASVLIAANAWSNQGTLSTALATSATAWLLGARNASNEYGDSFDDATALLALATQAGQSSALSQLMSALAATELGDGSWDEDPFLTALALRAFWLAGQAPISPTTGDVTGVVVDQSSGQPLSGVQIVLVENTGITAATGSDGSFRLSNVPAATYTLQLSRSGYQPRSLGIQVVAGQTFNVGAIALQAPTTTAVLSGVIKSNAGQLLQNVIVTVGTKSALTDATGTYQILGIGPGAGTITATLSGYKTVSATVTFLAGTTYLFSPTMYPTSVTPPATSLQGLIIDGKTNAPIVGVNVILGSTARTTDATGKFVFAAVTAGSYAMTFAANGYQAATASISVVAGVNDLGTIALQPSASATTLQGIVTDSRGSAIVNASIAVDNGPSSSSDTTGAYQLSGLVGTQFTIHVSAAGYVAQTFAFSVSIPGNYTQDFHLVAQQTTDITLGPLTIAPMSAGANAELNVSSTLVNGGDTLFEGVLMLEVRDATDAVVGSGVLTNTSGFSIGAVELQPSESLGVLGRWNTGQFAPGVYRFEMRLVVPNSPSRSNPLGTLILSQFASFSIAPTTHFTGTVAADPPVIQAGLNQIVNFAGVIKNDGNTLFPAQTVKLTVSDAKTGAIAFTGSANTSDLPSSGLINVDLGDWAPTAGGNYQLTIAAADPTLGNISGSLYVGNVATATFTVNPDSVLAGTRTVHGNIHVAGVDPAQATITDPLAPLIRTAIQKAVIYNDGTAHQWIDTNKCSSCHIGTQALIGGELTRSLTTFNALDRATIVNNIATNQAPNGGITAGYNDTSAYWPRLGTMALWGLFGYHDPLELQTVYKHAADWVVNIQSNDPASHAADVGRWASGYNATWFNNDISMSMLNLSNLRRTDALLKSNGITAVPTYASQALAANKPASSRGFLATSLDGNFLYYTDRSNSTANLIQPDGTLVTKWTGVTDPRGIVVRLDGQVWLSSGSGTFRLNGDGTKTLLASDSMDSFSVDADGTVWGVKIGDARGIYKLDSATGKASVWLSNGPFGQIGRVTPDSDGSLYVTDTQNAKIYRVLPDKSVTVMTEVMQGSRTPPSLFGLLKDGDHWLLATTNGIVRLTADWIGHRITWSRADEIRRLADGRIVYVGFALANVNVLVPQMEDVAGSLVNYAAATDRGEKWLRAQAIVTTDNLHMAQQLWGLGEAYRYYLPIDTARATAIHGAMSTLATRLRTNQNSNGSWGVNKGNAGDPVVTAQTGIALDYLNPSASDPVVRNAVAWLLSQQDGSGAWSSPLFTDGTKVSTTTMVAIWLPMILDRLGAIDAQISVKFPSNVQPGSFVTAPTQSAIDGAGNVTANWSLTGVTNDGVDLGFDLILKDLLPNEVRAVATDAHMTFGNSFNQQTITQAVYVPAVTATAPVSLSVATDHPDYPANATALVTTTLVNLDDVEISGNLVVNVYDHSGVFVGSVTQRLVNIPADGTLPVTDPFAIGTIVPAQYTVKAVFSNNGLVLAQGQTTFNILPDNAAAAATSTVHTDKQIYNPSDQVQILSRVESVSANTVLNDLSLQVDVYSSAETLQYTHTYTIAQLLPGQTLDFTGIEALSNTPPGLYAVKQNLFDMGGNLFNHVEAAYDVSSSNDTGFGLVGTIAAVPRSLPVGGTLTLNAAATNHGNSALNDLPLTITIFDPDRGTVMQRFNQTSTLAIAGTVPFDTTWVTQGTIGTTYYAVLSAVIGSGANAKTLTLAVDTFALTLKLDADVVLKTTKPPLAALVLINPNTNADEIEQVRTSLAALDYVATFVSTATDFAGGVRTGAYQLYLLLATQIAPDTMTLRLLREAVHRGEGVLSANAVAELPEALAQITGLAASITLPIIGAQSIDVLISAPGGAAQVAFESALPSRIVVPQLAQTQAVLTGRLPSTPDRGALSAELAAVGRIDIGYFGSDVGTNGSHLSLASMGRMRNPDGSDEYTVWRIRNSGDTVRNVVLSSASGGYGPALTITSHVDEFVASPIVNGTADHRLVEATQTIQTVPATTSAFTDARQVDVGDNPGAIALWANQIGTIDVLDWTGSQHVVHGAVHSNSDIRLAGAQNLIDGPVHYVSTFINSGNQNAFTFEPRPVEMQPLPTLLDLDDFKPGGRLATALGTQYIDASGECAASHHGWQRNSSQMPIASGLYWIPCDVHISGGNNMISNVTLVSSGAMQIDGVKSIFQPFYEGLQFATTSVSAGAIQLSGDATQIGGLVLAPNGTVQISGSSLSLQCSVIGNEIRFANAKTTIDARQCAYATIQRKAPAVLLNAFGDGWVAYAAFDWPGAISRNEANAPGELSSLFGGVLAEVAPTQNALRAGAVIPLKLSVQNLNDPFTGHLTLQANDDSTFAPSTISWALDFTQQDTFQAQSNVRLGSGGSTDVTATVSTAMPIVLNPLRQSTATITHLPGETINDLIAAAAAIGSPDVGLTATLSDLQAAQVAAAENDRESALGHLLDAAEASGQSANAQGDALRTRIDWVIWATTH
jgi:hypothetical protein